MTFRFIPEDQLPARKPDSTGRSRRDDMLGKVGLSFEPVDRLPERLTTRGPRDSAAHRAYLAARESPSGIVRVIADTQAALVRFYRSMNQWKKRHPATGVHVRKDGDEVFVFVELNQAPGESAE